MAEAQAPVHSDRVLHCDFTSPGGHAAAAQVLQGRRPTAIFAGNDMIGFGVLRAAAERNINVPGELSVIGFDDIELSRYVYPPLTTVGQSIRELGESAASLLLARIGTPGKAWPSSASSPRALSCANPPGRARTCSTITANAKELS